jgi:hypothetical protein
MKQQQDVSDSLSPQGGWRQNHGDHEDSQETVATRNSALQTRYFI